MKHHLTLAAIAFCGSLLIAPSVSAQTKRKVVPKAGSKPAPGARAIENANRIANAQNAKVIASARLTLAKLQLEYINRALNSAREKKSPMVHKPDNKFTYLGYRSSK